MRGLATALLILTCPLATTAVTQIAGPLPRGDVRPPNPFIGDSSLAGPDIRRDLGDINDRIESARENGALSKREARALKREGRRIGRLARLYGRDGLSESESRELEARARYLRDAVNSPIGDHSDAGGRGKRRRSASSSGAGTSP